jgi:hypothetical protein
MLFKTRKSIIMYRQISFNRYFRYQTDNGQFRKEKRLKDGTVIGL